MTDLDRATQDAINALIHRLKNRTDEDDEPFAQEFVMAMRHRGWRPTEARASWEVRKDPTGSGHPESEETLTLVEQTRRELDEIRARQHAERERMAAERPAGAA